MNTMMHPLNSSDSAIVKTLRQSVMDSSNVVVEESDEQVVLSGSVSSFYVKQVAQEAVRGHLGRRLLQNHLRVGS